jgi:hypothetical protein
MGVAAGGVAMLVVMFLTRRSRDRAAIRAAFFLKILSSYVMVAATIPIFHGGDMIGYHDHGIRYGRMLKNDFAQGTNDYLSTTPFFLLQSTNVHRCWSISGLLHFLLFDSYTAATIVFASIGFSGQILLHRTFVTAFPDPRLRIWWNTGLLFMPSLTFWSAGLLKDPIGIWGLGCTTWGIYRILAQGRAWGLVTAALGAYTLLLYRAQILPVILIAMAPLLFSSPVVTLKTRRRIPPLIRALSRVALAAAAVGVVHYTAQVERRFANFQGVDAMLEERYLYRYTEGGSTMLEADEDLRNTASTPLGMILLWPQAVSFTLFRPFLWEWSGSPLILAAALENTVLIMLTARATILALWHPRVLFAALRTPLFGTCLIFVALFAYGVGLSSPNLGTVSRYRIPVVPFFIGSLAIFEACYLDARGRGVAPAAGGAPAWGG